MNRDLSPLGQDELFARLAEGHAARLAVLTPNQRLAQSLQRRFDAFRQSRGESCWEAPDILPLGAFLERCHEEALYGAAADAVPALVTSDQERILWEESVRASRWGEELLPVAGTAALAAEGWALAHAWDIAGALGEWHGNEDAEAFADWARRYERHTRREGLVDAARLPELVASLLAAKAFEPPATLVLHAFDLVTPQQSRLLEAFGRAGTTVLRSFPPRVVSAQRRIVFDSPRRELEFAARWARARLEADPRARIAVVVPELAERRALVVRVFARMLGADTAAPLFNISLGVPLASVPLADAALAILELAAGPVAFDRASRLVRSPFLSGGENESCERARLDAALRSLAPPTLTLARLRSLMAEALDRRGAPACERLRQVLERVAAAARSGRAESHEWARRFTAVLDAAGFPGERTLDSTEFQALRKWREVIASFAALGPVAPACNFAQARARLQRLCADALFQPATGEAPVQVLGILESAGLDFDHLWVTGLTEESWPLAARAHPLIAPALQRRAGIPQATAEKSLEVGRAITAAWTQAAPEVLFSSARADGDRELVPSPLIAAIAECAPEDLAIADFPTLPRALFECGRAEGATRTRPDGLAPAIGGEPVRGGTAILSDQAACPFRAFAHYRLDARALEAPETGLGPSERGQLLHAMMARLWKSLGDQVTLKSIAPERLATLVEEAAAFAVAKVRSDRPGRLEGRFAELERERLAAIAREWLQIEARRPVAFEVLQREEPMTLSAGGLTLRGRVDRIDRLEGGGLAVIDYKSGAVGVSAWIGERPDDAQLPLYALAADEEVRAVAFARLKTGQLGFCGLARSGDLLPGVDAVDRNRAAKKWASSWDELLASWRAQVDKLGENFASGDARVDPKRPFATCERCDLQPLCRVHERMGPFADPDAAEEEAP